MKIVCIAGARPNFIKIAPLVHALQKEAAEICLVHTGQHYDRSMSDAFFEALQIPAPHANLEVGSGSHVWQIAEVMKRLEAVLSEVAPNAVLVVGDVNSTVAAAITAVKMGIPVAHVEAGLRSFDRTMPEETNRILTDSISTWLFTSEPSGEANLLHEGIAADKIHFVGNVMIDSLLKHREQAKQLRHFEVYGLKERQYALMTLHRPSNVDVRDRLVSILAAVEALGSRMKTLFVAHPRTRNRMTQMSIDTAPLNDRLILTDPVGYLEMLSLMNSAQVVFTDSGGVQEETTALGVPCLTIRENTERPITVEIGTNQLIGWRTDEIVTAAENILQNAPKHYRMPDLWDGHASERVAVTLKNAFV